MKIIKSDNWKRHWDKDKQRRMHEDPEELYNYYHGDDGSVDDQPLPGFSYFKGERDSRNTVCRSCGERVMGEPACWNCGFPTKMNIMLNKE